MKWFAFFNLFFGIAVITLAQYSNDLVFGVKAGVSQSAISQLSPIFVSESYYTGYTFTEQKQINPVASLFINQRINSSRISLEGQVGYYQYNTKLAYSDIKDFTYTSQFQYHYLGVATYIKTLIVGGFNVGAGMRLGINLTPDNITYRSNSAEIIWAENSIPPSDKETQDELRGVINGLNTTEIGIVASYEFAMGLSMDFSYYAGLNDAVETLVNRHNFIDPNNRTSSLQFTLGYAIAVDQSKKDKRRRK